MEAFSHAPHSSHSYLDHLDNVRVGTRHHIVALGYMYVSLPVQVGVEMGGGVEASHLHAVLGESSRLV